MRPKGLGAEKGLRFTAGQARRMGTSCSKNPRLPGGVQGRVSKGKIWGEDTGCVTFHWFAGDEVTGILGSAWSYHPPPGWEPSVQFSSVAQSCPTLCDSWTAAHQASLSRDAYMSYKNIKKCKCLTSQSGGRKKAIIVIECGGTSGMLEKHYLVIKVVFAL